MRKVINRKVYDTKTANLVSHNISGEWGDPQGYEEFLYMTKKGAYFIYGVGGSESKYPQETIVVIDEEQAKNF